MTLSSLTRGGAALGLWLLLVAAPSGVAAQGELPGAANQPPTPPYPGSTDETITPEPPTAAPPPSTEAEQAAARRMGTPEETQPAPPPSTPPPAPQQALEPESERKRLFYFQASAAYTWIDLGQFRQNNLVSDVVRVDGNGYGFSGAAGVQVAFLTLGLHGMWSRYPAFDLGTVALDVGFRIPVPVVSPYIRVGVGYAWLTHLVDPGLDQSIQGVTGLTADAGVGVSIPVNDLFAFDVGFDAAVINVRRDPMNLTDLSGGWTPTEDGEAIGLRLTLHAGINLRF